MKVQPADPGLSGKWLRKWRALYMSNGFNFSMCYGLPFPLS